MFKNLKRKQLISLIVSLSLILVLSVGITIAYILINTNPVTNTFDPAQVSCAVVENGSEKGHYKGQIQVFSKSDVMIKNTGDTDAYIRASVIITWKSADGKVYAQAPSADDYTMVYAKDTGWELGADGFWYYTSSVPAAGFTNVLITSCTTNKTLTANETTYYLSVEIVASAIQSAPDSVVEKQWVTGVSNADSGKLSIKKGE